VCLRRHVKRDFSAGRWMNRVQTNTDRRNVMSNYSFADCLRQSYKVNWRISEVLGDTRFDTSKRWLPDSLSGATGITCLNPDELRQLTQVEMAAYAHLFGYVEEFVAPQIVALASEHGLDNRDAFDALTNFAAEEAKHMALFRETGARVGEAIGFEPEHLTGAADTARFVLSKNTGAVLLLTAAIEWLTQRHFTDAWRADADLDPLTKRIFRAHWVEEAQHAKMDHLEAVRAFGNMDDRERDVAIDDLIELLMAVDGLLQSQSRFDVDNFERRLDRVLTTTDRAEVHKHVLRAKRWTFIETGVTHPRFEELFVGVATPDQRARVRRALQPVLGASPVAVAC
jgi:hypothetical protein